MKSKHSQIKLRLWISIAYPDRVYSKMQSRIGQNSLHKVVHSTLLRNTEEDIEKPQYTEKLLFGEKQTHLKENTGKLVNFSEIRKANVFHRNVMLLSFRKMIRKNTQSSAEKRFNRKQRCKLIMLFRVS